MKLVFYVLVHVTACAKPRWLLMTIPTITHTWVTTLHVLWFPRSWEGRDGGSHLKVRGYSNLVPRAPFSQNGVEVGVTPRRGGGEVADFGLSKSQYLFCCNDIPHKVVRKRISSWRETKAFILCWNMGSFKVKQSLSHTQNSLSDGLLYVRENRKRGERAWSVLGAWNRRLSSLQEVLFSLDY